MVDAYVISLPRRQDRRDEWVRDWSDYPVTGRFIDGIDGKTLPAEQVDAHMRTTLACGHRIKNRRHFAGTLGCLLAHRRAWTTWLEHGRPGGYLLVMEDDASPAPGMTRQLWTKQLDRAVHEAASRPGFLMLNLGAKIKRHPKPVPGATSIAFSGRDTQCLHAMLYTPAGVEAMLDVTSDHAQPLDFAWQPLLETGRCYSTSRWMVVQRFSYSDISHQRRSAHLDHRQRNALVPQPPEVTT